MAVVALLAMLAGPPLFAAIERGRVGRVLVDLQTIEVALEAYRTDHGVYPPVTASCMQADEKEVLQLPLELADGNYLPPKKNSATSTLLLDPFTRNQTYKYIAPEPYWLNGSKMSERYPVWVPSDFPSCRATGGRLDDSPRSPVAWAVWSQGPRPTLAKGLNERAPLPAATWYARAGDNGVIARYKERDGATWSTLR